MEGIDRTVLGIILGGGAGSRLYPLTKKRAKPAVPLGANYRLIDIPVSNCLHSNINKIYCLTQFNSASLNRHVSHAYNDSVGGSIGARGFVDVLAATQTPRGTAWFQGAPPAHLAVLRVDGIALSLGLRSASLQRQVLRHCGCRPQKRCVAGLSSPPWTRPPPRPRAHV